MRRSKRGIHRQPEKIYSSQEANDRLFDIFRNHEFGDYPHEKRQQLVDFYISLMENQKTNNFTRLLKFNEIAIKHFIDCLMVPRLTKLKFPLVDMGTGPGFPGIPLKIEFPEDRIILVEGVRKRVDYLKLVRDKMQLKNLDVIGRYVTPEFSYPVNGVITRAVMSCTETLYNISQCLNVSGEAYLMKGPNVDADVKAAIKTCSEHFKHKNTIEYTLPNTPHKRTLVVFEKIKTPTDADLSQWAKLFTPSEQSSNDKPVEKLKNKADKTSDSKQKNDND